MPRVFKKKSINKETGKQEQSGKWYVEFRDHREIKRRVPATKHKSISQKFADNLERLVGCRIAGQPVESEHDLLAWVRNLPAEHVQRLVKFGLLDSRWAASSKSLNQHVEAFEQYLSQPTNGRAPRSAKHVRQTIRRVRRILEQTGEKAWANLTQNKIATALAELQKNDRLSSTTRNHYLANIRGFGNFMENVQQAGLSPVRGIGKLDERSEGEQRQKRPTIRRPLTSDEQARLIVAAEAGETMKGRSKRGVWWFKRYGEELEGHVRWVMTGPERAALYRVALDTGFRASAIRRLRVRDFTLDGDAPTVTLPPAAATKNRAEITNPLSPQTTAALRRCFATKLPDASAFNMPGSQETADLVRTDLLAARQRWIDEAEGEEKAKRIKADTLRPENSRGQCVDFHALRHTTGSNLARLGTPRAVTQRIMGHANYGTTDRYYTTITDDEKREAMAKVTAYRQAN